MPTFYQNYWQNCCCGPCECCIGSMATSRTVTILGLTGLAAIYNGTYVVTQGGTSDYPAGSCGYRYTYSDGSTIDLLFACGVSEWAVNLASSPADLHATWSVSVASYTRANCNTGWTADLSSTETSDPEHHADGSSVIVSEVVMSVLLRAAVDERYEQQAHGPRPAVDERLAHCGDCSEPSGGCPRRAAGCDSIDHWATDVLYGKCERFNTTKTTT